MEFRSLAGLVRAGQATGVPMNRGLVGSPGWARQSRLGDQAGTLFHVFDVMFIARTSSIFFIFANSVTLRHITSSAVILPELLLENTKKT